MCKQCKWVVSKAMTVDFTPIACPKGVKSVATAMKRRHLVGKVIFPVIPAAGLTTAISICTYRLANGWLIFFSALSRHLWALSQSALGRPRCDDTVYHVPNQCR